MPPLPNGDPISMSIASWIKRDKRVVWHGFTQMSCYDTSTPVIVETGEGNYLIAVEDNRYLDAISSLWVMTIGHNDPDLNQAAVDQLLKISHSTLLGNGNVAPIELAEALAPQVPVPEPHFLFASDGAATGFGRTGTLFASEQCGIAPDIMCLGKGITGGYAPLSATAAAPHIYETFLGPDLGERTFYHGHSYSGNALAAVDILEGCEGKQLKATLRSNIDQVRPGHPSPIIPVVLGDEDRAMTVSSELQKMGILVPAIRPPTVAPGTSRLRLTVSAAHTPGDMRRLLSALDSAGVDAT